MDGPSDAHLTEIEITVLIGLFKHLVASPDLDTWMQVKLSDAALAPTLEQLNSIAVPH